MIGHLSGTLLDKHTNDILLDVGGVGYEVSLTMNAWFGLPDTGEPVSLYTHLVVREDAQLLYGFSGQRERALFRELTRISGIGPKVALAILSGMDTSALVAAIQRDDVAAMVKIPGVGKKTAERLLIELRDRLAGLPEFAAVESVAGREGELPALDDLRTEAELALSALGYKPADVRKMLDSAPAELTSVEQLVRFALRGAHRS